MEQVLNALSMYPIFDRHYLPTSRSKYYSCAFVVDDQVVEMELLAVVAGQAKIGLTELGWMRG